MSNRVWIELDTDGLDFSTPRADGDTRFNLTALLAPGTDPHIRIERREGDGDRMTRE